MKNKFVSEIIVTLVCLLFFNRPNYNGIHNVPGSTIDDGVSHLVVNNNLQHFQRLGTYLFYLPNLEIHIFYLEIFRDMEFKHFNVHSSEAITDFYSQLCPY